MLSKILHNTYFQTTLFILAALFVGAAGAFGGFKLSILMLSAILGLAVACVSVKDLKVGIVVVILMGFFLALVKLYTLTEISLGTAIDGFLIMLFISAWLKSVKERKPLLPSGVFNTVLLLYFAFQVLEIANPSGYSKTAWLFSFRQMFSIYMIYFVGSYAINTLKFATIIIKVWIALCLLAAIYGLSQEFLGFRDFELRWLNLNPDVANRYFTFGKWRRFSFFASPMDFGIMMAFTSVMCLALAFGPFSQLKRLALLLFSFLMFWAMMYTGTRTAYVLMPVGLVFYALITFRKVILIGLSIFLIAGTIVILRPATNQTVFVLQTAFMGSKDASYMVREKNKEFIKPFILSHPFGGGMGSCGLVGQRYTPGTMLSNFQPDSEFVKVAVDQGWIGLILFCLLFSTAMHLGIKNYFEVKNPRIKTYYVAIVSAMFMIMIGCYPQEALQLTVNVFMGLAFALITKMRHFDHEPTISLKENKLDVQ